MYLQKFSNQQLHATFHGISIWNQGAYSQLEIRLQWVTAEQSLQPHKSLLDLADAQALPAVAHNRNAFLTSLILLQIVFNTDQNVGNLQDHLAYIYSNLYVEYVMKNPLYEPGQPFR